MTYSAKKRGGALMIAAAVATAPTIVSFAAQSADSRATVPYGKLPEAAYAVVAEVRAKPGMEEKLREATLPLVAQVRNEPNNLVYFLHEDRAKPGHFIFYEIFATEADFQAHNATPHVQAWFARLPELAESGVAVTHMQLRGNAP
ncbi:putative quinol monooxygenase [Bosea sp. CCNWLW174]|uniref:putative quinol monooxygenase n=1 Tax=unclassified Bosea (in: a-proteobacteria) TaxID=2653178 RepID=UPI0030143259